MPRKGKILSQKRQAPKDFVKVTNKVGKKKQAAANDTKTDFKVKQVQMPSQSALGEKGEEVTHRRLGLSELLAHAQHHSSKVRRDAFGGLHELCNLHTGVLNTNISRILDATAMSAIDSSADVREAFRKFQCWLIEELPAGALSAFAPTLALHVRSALSHVSSEVRDDGLLLLELYASRLGKQVLSQAEATRIVETLCQLTSKTDAVLRCLYRLHTRPSQSIACASSAKAIPTMQLSLQDVLRGRLGGAEDETRAEDHVSAETAGQAQEDSAIWGLCLRAWLQAGELTSSGGRPSAAAEKPGWVKLHCVAVLERVLEELANEAASHGRAVSPSSASLRPSAAQVATLAGVVRRGEWPLQVDKSSPLRPLVDSVNLRMARMLGLLLTCCGDVAEMLHLTRLARAALRFLEDFIPASSTSALGSGTAAAAAAAVDPDAELSVFSGTAGAAYALRALDLLWASSASPGASMGRSALGPEDIPRLVAVTSRLMSGESPAGDDAAVAGSITILSVPLAAALLGLRPGAALAAGFGAHSPGNDQAVAPASVQPAWPSALLALGEPCFAEVIEKSSPGTAAMWVSAWPKMLWYLGESDPALSSLLLALLLELAKQASYRGNPFLEKLLAESVCPLLVPFLTGTPAPGAEKEDHAPPLARLPRGLAGAQGLAAALLPHFPRLSEPFVARLTWLICRWSDVGLAGANSAPVKLGGSGTFGDGRTHEAPVGLGIDCCELILQALLYGNRLKSSSGVLQLRLRVALSVLVAVPWHSPASVGCASCAESAALRLADAVAEWLMSDCGGGQSNALDTDRSCEAMELAGLCAVAGLSFDDRRRLALQSLAWPLCVEALTGSPSCASRILCFLFFCAARLPQGHAVADCSESGAGDCGSADSPSGAKPRWPAFLCQLFRTLVLGDSGRALRAGCQGRAAAIAGPLCNPARGSGAAHAVASVEPAAAEAVGEAEASHRLGQLFVEVWMRAVPPPQRPSAYEMLVKLCVHSLRGSMVARPPGEDVEQSATAALTVILVAAISYRNESGLATGGWGSAEFLATTGLSADLASRSRDELQVELTACVCQLEEGGGPVELKAMLLLL